MKESLQSKTIPCLQQQCQTSIEFTKLDQSTLMIIEQWLHHKILNMVAEVDLRLLKENKDLIPELLMVWSIRHSSKAISSKQPTSIHNLKRKATYMRIDCMQKQALIRQNLQRSKNNMIIRCKTIQMRCIESIMDPLFPSRKDSTNKPCKWVLQQMDLVWIELGNRLQIWDLLPKSLVFKIEANPKAWRTSHRIKIIRHKWILQDHPCPRLRTHNIPISV